MKVSKTQISWGNPLQFAVLSQPRRAAQRRTGALLATLGLGRRVEHPRILQAVEPYPGRWTHHLLLTAPEDVDGLLAAWLAAGALSTRHFAGLLRRDAALLTAATGAIAARRLDVPLDGGARVRELGESLAAMEQLRQALARSLSEQWAMEQERTQALAALAHDLKTPLSIVSGSAELLEEDALSPAQRERVDAILRSAGRIRDYMEQLRALTAAGGPVRAGGGLGGRWARPVRPQGAALFSGLPRLPPLYPVPVRVGPGGAQPAGQRRPLHPGGGRGAPVGVCGGGRTHRGRGGLRPRLLPRGPGPGGAGLLHRRR